MQENYFTVHPSKINQNSFTLSKEESNHIIKSLRGKIGDEIWLLDGLGVAHQGSIDSINDQYVSGLIIDSYSNYGESNFSVNLIIGLIKGHRMDIILEKATELGVKTIQPLLMDHCVKTKLNRDRAEKIIIAAAKQTGRSLFPKVYEPISLSDWLSDHNMELSIACYMNGNNSISDVIAGDQKTINIIIGPEGDFSNTELNQFQDAKIELVNLSSRRLRSESAAIVSIANVNQIMEHRYE